MKHNNIFFIYLILIFFSGVGIGTSYGNPIITDDYEISEDKINKAIREGNILEDFIEIKNKQEFPLSIDISIGGGVEDLITLLSTQIIVEPRSSSKISFNIKGASLGEFNGEMVLSKDISEKIPINISIVDFSLDPIFLIQLDLLEEKFSLTKEIESKLTLIKLKPLDIENISLIYNIINSDNRTIQLGSEIISLENSKQLYKKFKFPENLSEGYYVFQVLTTHNNKTTKSESLFIAKTPFLSTKLFGFLPIWMIIAFAILVLTILLTIYLIKRHIENSKKYKMTLDMKTLQKKEKNSLWLGKIAEKNEDAYIDPYKLTTHCITAGATGGGKSIAAQV
ncbi:hypothetical protein KAI32_04275, partial [Candidatus Pacearchaeota archaeon]|nr:hypothetical protein [Candidatus Pacearchaeota archaeon]